MEPARDERGDDQKDAAEITQINAPQWSPLAMSGATQGPGRGQAPALRAAMEPARDERGDRNRLAACELAGVAAMEPARDERGDPPVHDLAGHGLRAAMEPARDERGDRAATSSARWNASAPQWSPLAMSGATRSSAPDGPA